MNLPDWIEKDKPSHVPHKCRTSDKYVWDVYRKEDADEYLTRLTTYAQALAEENERLRDALIGTGRAIGCFLTDEVSTDFLMGLPDEAKLVMAKFRTPPEGAERGDK